MAFLLQNYFWCAERGKTVGMIIAIGLVINIALNAWWVPVYGLRGAMTATSLSGGAILFLTIFEMRRCGVRLGWRCLCFTALPTCLLFGCVPAALVLATVLILIGRTDWLLSDKEKKSLDDAITPKLNKMGFPIRCLWASGSIPR